MARTELMRWQPARPPSRIQRMVDVVRSYTLGPWSTKDKALTGYLGRGSSSSGVRVDEEIALTCSAVWDAVVLVSEDVSSLPLKLYRRLEGGGKAPFENHPLYRLLHDAPNSEMSSMVWRRTMHAHAMLWGNAYSEIERDGAGRPVAFWPLTPDRVSLFRQDGRLKFRYVNPSGGDVDFEQRDIIHIAGLSFDGGAGYNVVDKARESIALAIAAERFGSTFFGNNAQIGGVVTFKGSKPSPESEDNKRAELAARHEGVDRAHRLLLLYNDAQFKQTAVEPNNAQFLETRVFQIREVARRWKIPPHKLGDLADATFSNVEQEEISYRTSRVRPDLELWEQELSRKLIAPSERNIQVIEHVKQGMLAVDAAGRAALYAAEFTVGGITSNEIREFEGLNPIKGGDRAFVQGAMVPLDRIDDIIDAQIAAKKAPPAAPVVDPEPIVEEVKSLRRHVEAAHVEVVSDLRAKAETSANAIRDLTERYDTLTVERDRLAGQLTAAETTAIESSRIIIEFERGQEQSTALHQTLNAHIERLKAENTAAHEAHQVELAAVEVARDQALQRAVASERDAVLQAESVVLARAERDVARADVEQITARHATVAQELQAERVAMAEIERSLAEALGRRDIAEGDLAAIRDRHAAAVIELAATQAALAERASEQQISQAVTAELRAQVESQAATIQQLQSAAGETESSLATARAQATERAAALTASKDHLVEVERSVTVGLSRLALITQSHRALVVDAVERLLQVESDRARKAQATPEKLRAWIESFYPIHGDRCRAAYRPVVIAWAACSGASVDRALAELVAVHVDESMRDLQLVADVDDPDVMAAQLALVLRRWETERPQAVADRLMAEGERYGS